MTHIISDGGPTGFAWLVLAAGLAGIILNETIIPVGGYLVVLLSGVLIMAMVGEDVYHIIKNRRSQRGSGGESR